MFRKAPLAAAAIVIGLTSSAAAQEAESAEASSPPAAQPSEAPADPNAGSEPAAPETAPPPAEPAPPAQPLAAPAEPAPQPAASAAPNPVAPALTPASTSPIVDTPPADEEDEERMGGAGVGAKIAYQHMGEATFDSGMGITGSIPSRQNVVVSVPIDLGGSGFGFQAAPFFGTGDSDSIGAFLGLMYRFQFEHVYPHLGAGVQAGYLLEDAIDLGLDAYGRVPLGVTYYATRDLAVVGEVGVSYGATGMKPKALPTTAAGVPDPELEFGTSLALDAGIGMRWP